MAHDKDRVVYKDERIVISQAESPDEHHLTVDGENGAYCFLARGILRDFAERKDMGDIKRSFHAMNPNFLYNLEQRGVPLEIVAWSLSKARINELEKEVGYFVEKSRENH